MLADALATFREQSVLAENLSIPMFQNRDLGHADLAGRLLPGGGDSGYKEFVDAAVA